jgi:hypothetical protein
MTPRTEKFGAGEKYAQTLAQNQLLPPGRPHGDTLSR